MASQSTIKTFISKVGSIAQTMYRSHEKWVLPSVVIAQAALESGWNLNAGTLFGIKSTDGKGVSYTTQEYVNGQKKTIQAVFKTYPSVAAAVEGYYDLITGLDRYRAAVCNPDYKSTITAIKAGGYATDPDYISKIVSIIEKYNLTSYDVREIPIKVLTDDEITAVARKVIRGDYGNGYTRKVKLEAAGYDYAAVQKKVNELMVKELFKK